MRHLTLHEHARNHTDDLTLIVENFIGKCCHQTDVRSAVDDTDTPFAKQSSKSACRLHVFGARAGVGPEKSRQPSDPGHVRGWAAAIMLTPSPASDWPPSQTTIAPVMNRAPSLDKNNARSATSS